MLILTLSPRPKSTRNDSYLKMEAVTLQLVLGVWNKSFAFLTLRNYANDYLLISSDKTLDGEFYVLDEVYGEFFG